jgi:hypothetical protein
MSAMLKNSLSAKNGFSVKTDFIVAGPAGSPSPTPD